MGDMATWEDGPEYAPAERPAEFFVPEAPALEVLPPSSLPAATAPKDRPAFDAPAAPVVDLQQLVPAVRDERDPARPFDVAGSTVTSMDSAWGSAHWSPPGGPYAPPGAAPPPGAVWPAPAPAPGQPWNGAPQWPGPSTPFPPASGPLPPVNGYPPPGTPQWFGPGPAPLAQPPAMVPYDYRAVLDAATPGLCLCLTIGGLTHLFSPAMLVVSYFLASRVRVAQRQARAAMFVGLVALVFFAIIGYLRYGVADSIWWDYFGRWGQLICWVLLFTVAGQVRRALKRRSGPPPGYPPSWR